MKLRRQLFFISLAVLVILPWTVFQYLFVFDQIVRDEQSAALTATATAIAARLGAEPALFQSYRPVAVAEQLYAHRLPRAPILDGFNNDWKTYSFTPQTFTEGSDFKAQISAGIYKDTLSFFIQVTDADVYYHSPNSHALATGDHLILAVAEPSGEQRYYIISSSSPGNVQVNYRDSFGMTQVNYLIKGFWRETQNGYQIELQMPASFSELNFALAIVDASPIKNSRALGTLNSVALIAGGRDPGVLPAITGQLVTTNPALQNALAVFVRPGLQLRLVDPNQWRLAQAGSLKTQQTQTPRAWPLQILLNAIRRKRELTPYSHANSGHLTQASVTEAMSGTSNHHWYQDGDDDIGVFAAPIYLNWQMAGAVELQLAGAVLVEVRRDPWKILSGKTLQHLLTITLGGGLLLAFILFAYASWLSSRIKRLSLAANAARDNQKQIEQVLQHWPRHRINDELSDLSGHYYALLQRVRGYTDYLKTLSSKLSHELRTPLAVIRTSLDNLANSTLSTEAAKYSHRAQEGAERLSAILTAMTEATRVEASIQNAEKETLNLAQLLEEMTAAYKDIYPKHSFELNIEAGSVKTYQTFSAPELLVQMLDKLIDNATDFSPEGQPIIIALQRIELPSPFFQLSIRNEGSKLPAHLKGQLFDSLTSSRTKVTDSNGKVHLGLGLHIVQLIVQFHGGQAEICSGEDETGAVVTLKLPVEAPAIRVKR